MTRLSIIIAATGFLAVAAPLSAQGAIKKRSEIPKEQRPPAGMCRIWLDGVPAGQQPAPTDCATAIRHRPPKGRVVFGEPVDTPRFDRKALERDREHQPSRDRDSQSVDRHLRMDSISQPDRIGRRNNPATNRPTNPPPKPPVNRVRPRTESPTRPRPVIRHLPVRRDTSSVVRRYPSRF
jgi:hypothetical protein